MLYYKAMAKKLSKLDVIQKPILFVLGFAIVGSLMLFLARAETVQVPFEAEGATVINSGITYDSETSGGQYIEFGGLNTGSGDCDFPQQIVPATEMPTKQEIINCAGLLDVSLLTPSGSITTNQDGQVIENLDINGIINISHNDVLIRNVRVRGVTTNAVLIRPNSGVTGTVIEHCEVESLATESEKTNGIGFLGNYTTVRYCEVKGSNGDGIKAESNSLYEYNYVHMTKEPGHAVHLDGLQGSGDSDWTARYNVVDMRHEDGGNSSLFAQGWNGSSCRLIANVTFHNNYINGGNHGINVAGGKKDKCPQSEDSYVTNFRAINNIFEVDSDGIFGSDSLSGFRYYYYNRKYVKDSEFTVTGNILSDGRELTSGITPHP